MAKKSERTALDDVNESLVGVVGNLYRDTQNTIAYYHAYVVSHPCRITPGEPSIVQPLGLYNLTFVGDEFNRGVYPEHLHNFLPISKKDLTSKEARNLAKFNKKRSKKA
jgi:hypothetical protein